MATVEQVLEAEAQALERKLEASPEFRRLRVVRQALQDLIGLGGQANGTFVAPMSLFETDAPAAPKVSNFFGGGRRVATSIAQAALFVLEDKNQPVSSRQLLEDIRLYGRAVGGKNQVWSLSNTLSSDSRFVSIPWGGAKAWWIAGRPTPVEQVDLDGKVGALTP